MVILLSIRPDYISLILFSSAGVFCAIVSHPADTVVSKLNNDVGSTPIQAARDLGMRGEQRTVNL